MLDYHNDKMLGSEEEFESQTQPGMTKAELRRVINVLQLDDIFICGQHLYKN